MKNIKLTMITAALFLLAGVVNSVNAQSPVSFGIKGGLNIANFNGSDNDLDSRQAMVIGASLDFSLPMLPIGIESGVYYSQKGAESGNSSLQVDYIEVPVLAKISFGPPGPFSPHLVVGPNVGFNINSEFESPAGNTVNLDDDTNDVEVGALFGLGADFNFGVTTLNAQVRYNYGLTAVYDDGDEKNGVLSVVVGIGF